MGVTVEVVLPLVIASRSLTLLGKPETQTAGATGLPPAPPEPALPTTPPLPKPPVPALPGAPPLVAPPRATELPPLAPSELTPPPPLATATLPADPIKMAPEPPASPVEPPSAAAEQAESANAPPSKQARTPMARPWSTLRSARPLGLRMLRRTLPPHLLAHLFACQPLFRRRYSETRVSERKIAFQLENRLALAFEIQPASRGALGGR
jgi:hypothetical protein